MRNAVVTAVVVVALPVIAWAQGVPSGALREGTLANAKLIQDAKVGVAAKVATMGCSQPEKVEFFVVTASSISLANQWCGIAV